MSERSARPPHATAHATSAGRKFGNGDADAKTTRTTTTTMTARGTLRARSVHDGGDDDDDDDDTAAVGWLVGGGGGCWLDVPARPLVVPR